LNKEINLTDVKEKIINHFSAEFNYDQIEFKSKEEILSLVLKKKDF